MFRRRKPENVQPPSQPALTEVESDLEAATPPQPRSFPSQGPAMNTKPMIPPTRPDIPRRVMDIPGAARLAPTPAPQPTDSECKKLIVGRDISLAGNITACDKLIVEGTVEANLTDARTIVIAETGLFKGSAEVDEAEIGGRFEGGLVVRKKLTIGATGKVEGTVRYARLIVEGGGEISGTVEVMRGTGARSDEPKPADEPQAPAPVFQMAEPK